MREKPVRVDFGDSGVERSAISSDDEFYFDDDYLQLPTHESTPKNKRPKVVSEPLAKRNLYNDFKMIKTESGLLQF